jgi:hypothetical protein
LIFFLSFRKQFIDNEQFFSFRVIKPDSGESEADCYRRERAQLYKQQNNHDISPELAAEYERLPDKQTESQVTDEILKEVFKHLLTYINSESLRRLFEGGSMWVELPVLNFKRAYMHTSSLSVAIIEAALTVIVDRNNNENITDDKQYAALKQAPYTVSYTSHTEDGFMCNKGVRLFQFKPKQKEQSQTQ